MVSDSTPNACVTNAERFIGKHFSWTSKGGNTRIQDIVENARVEGDVIIITFANGLPRLRLGCSDNLEEEEGGIITARPEGTAGFFKFYSPEQSS